jgi:glycine/D-amino acid oxidase-like deaminating enzyme
VRIGLRPACVDDRPVLGAIPGWPNIHVATGHGTEGLLLGPYTAALLAESIVSGKVGDQIVSLSPERFALPEKRPRG